MGILEQSVDSNVLSDSDSTRLPFDVADWAPNPEAQYRATELREILISTLQRLTPALKIVFVLRDIEEYSLSETSEILNLNFKVRSTIVLNKDAEQRGRRNTMIQALGCSSLGRGWNARVVTHETPDAATLAPPADDTLSYGQQTN